MQYQVTGQVPAPDGQGLMTRVVVRVPEGEVVWLTRDPDGIESRLRAFYARLRETTATHAGVLDEEEDDQTEGR